MDKKQAFGYFVFKLHEWYEDLNPNQLRNDLSKLKILKLLFFGSAINSNEEDSLLDFFNKFCAMPYGHVESDIYTFIQNGEEFKGIELFDRHSLIKTGSRWDVESDVLYKKIDKAIRSLRLENNSLINMSSSDLVNLSHQWYSWRYYFNKAKSKGLYSEIIPLEIIRNEEKFYSL